MHLVALIDDEYANLLTSQALGTLLTVYVKV
jgi:hypothetical protein